MELDLGREWRLFLASAGHDDGFVSTDRLSALIASPGSCEGPAEFAACELARGFGLVAGRPLLPGTGREGDEVGVVILDCGPVRERSADRRRGFAWRAAETRLEVHGDTAAGLLAGVYDILDKAGLLWPAPGLEMTAGMPASFTLPAPFGRSENGRAAPVLILGNGPYLVAASDYMLWAARNGYAGVFFHTIRDPLAIGAAPEALFERLRPGLAALAQRLGLVVEEGGHGLSALVPRSLFRKRPELFRMVDGARRPDRNFCVSNADALGLLADNFARFVRARPEVDIFHVWPDDLPGGGWCECPLCEDLGPAAQSLRAALVLADVLASERPGARLSFLAYHDTEDLAAAVSGASLPANLELLWAPRKRSWARGYGDPECGLNAASRAGLESARSAFAAAGGRSVSVFEYWEDALLFKTAVPPLSGVMEEDLAVYAPEADAAGILLTGGDRLPLAPRPNPWLFPRLMKEGADSAALMTSWIGAVYGPAAGAMGRYWAALEAAWAIDLDIEPGDTDLFMPEPIISAVDHPPADWGDPWKADARRLAIMRGRCDGLFDLLREAEAALARARENEDEYEDAGGEEPRWAKAVEDEAAEYAISSGVLELDCARLSAYHELANGEVKAAAEIALIARSVLDGVLRALRALPDRRSRRGSAFLLYIFYDLRLRQISRAASNILGRSAGRLAAFLGLAARAWGIRRAWERARPVAGGPAER
jgi:hypothetical protein